MPKRVYQTSLVILKVPPDQTSIHEEQKVRRAHLESGGEVDLDNGVARAADLGQADEVEEGSVDNLDESESQLLRSSAGMLCRIRAALHLL